MPPATLSARLRGFEKELGMELFQARCRRSGAPEAGERLLPSAEEILASLRQLRGELKEAERHRYSRLRIGEVDIYFASVMRDFEIPGLTKTTVTASSQYLLLPRFHRLANRTTVSLRELDGSALYPTPAPGKTAFVISSSAASKPPG